MYTSEYLYWGKLNFKNHLSSIWKNKRRSRASCVPFLLRPIRPLAKIDERINASLLSSWIPAMIFCRQCFILNRRLPFFHSALSRPEVTWSEEMIARIVHSIHLPVCHCLNSRLIVNRTVGWRLSYRTIFMFSPTGVDYSHCPHFSTHQVQIFSKPSSLIPRQNYIICFVFAFFNRNFYKNLTNFRLNDS